MWDSLMTCLVSCMDVGCGAKWQLIGRWQKLSLLMLLVQVCLLKIRPFLLIIWLYIIFIHHKYIRMTPGCYKILCKKEGDTQNPDFSSVRSPRPWYVDSYDAGDNIYIITVTRHSSMWSPPPPFILCILLPIHRAKLPNSKRIVLVPKCYV